MLRLISGVLKLLIAGAILGVVALGAAVAVALAGLPGFEDLRRSPVGQTVQVLAADGTPLVTLGPSYGRWLPYAQTPRPMAQAMVAVEDKRFWSHPGIDPIGMGRALRVNVQKGGRVQGASTITQQLARNIFLTNARTVDRKLREIVLALALEQKFSKEQILELYLNRVYFGGGAYGVDAAARRFFGHPAERLSLAKAAVIAGLVKAPSRYAPSADPEAARARAATVLAVMAAQGAMPDPAATRAELAALRFVDPPAQGNVRYFTDWVLADLEALTDESIAPLVVYTTLDPRMQAAAEAAVAGARPTSAQAAIVAMERDGAVKAMVGGRDYARSNYNRAVAAQRQPGSAFKLFVYLAALENGLDPAAMVRDAPVTINGWSPRNSNGRFLGEISGREAFARSVNTVAVRLAGEAGYGVVADMARRLGLTTPIDTRPAMALGASEATLLEMTQAYAVIANGGASARAYGVERVVTGDGVELWRREPPATRVLLGPNVNAAMTGLLKAAVETGTGRAAQMGRELAGKTGTTSSNRDGWFLGFTSDLVAGVWMGRDDARPVAGLAGGAAPARAFAAFMGRASRGRPGGALNTEIASVEGLIEPDAEVYGLDGAPYAEAAGDPAADGEAPPPADPAAPSEPAAPPEPGAEPRIDEAWLDGVLKGEREPATP